MLHILSKKNPSMMKLSLDILTQLAKSSRCRDCLSLNIDVMWLLAFSEANSARAVSENAVPLLLQLFDEWQHRHVSLSKGVLHVLRHLVNLRSGRRAFLEHNGLLLLFDMCEIAGLAKNRGESGSAGSSSVNKLKQVADLGSLVPSASIILRKCFPRNKLPVSHYNSPIGFALPQSVVSDSVTAHVLPFGAVTSSSSNNCHNAAALPAAAAGNAQAAAASSCKFADGPLIHCLYCSMRLLVFR